MLVNTNIFKTEIITVKGIYSPFKEVKIMTTIQNKNKKATETTQRTLTPIPDESFFKFENVGDMLSGVYSEQGYSERWKKPLYTVGDKRFLGKTQLDRLMSKVSIGDFLEIELMDTLETPNGTMMIFEVRK